MVRTVAICFGVLWIIGLILHSFTLVAIGFSVWFILEAQTNERGGE